MPAIRVSKLSREDWLALRHNIIGASEAGAILGFGMYEDQTAYKVWERKVAAFTAADGGSKEMTQAQKMGLKLEPVVAELFTEATGIKVKKSPFLHIAKGYPFLGASVDYIGNVKIPDSSARPCVVELKTVSSRARDKWDDEVPLTYYAQAQQQLLCTGFDIAFFAVLEDGRWFNSYRVERNETYLAEHVQKLKAFWYENVLPRVPPAKRVADFESSKSVAPKAIEATEEIIGAHRSYIETLQTKTAAEKIVKAYGDTIKQFMGDNEALTHEGQMLATWKLSKPTQEFDLEAFQEQHPDLYAQFMNEKPGSRRFSVKGGK